MKNLFLFCAAMLLFVGCNSESSEPNNPNLDGLVLDAKWEIEDSEIYEFFEFTSEGTYIVKFVGNDEYNAPQAFVPSKNAATKADNEGAIFGTYESDGDDAVNMIGFGRLEVVSSNSDSVEFTLTLEDEETSETFNSSIVEPMSTSTKTTMLCRTWVVSGYTNSFEPDYEYDLATVLFSKSYTYLVGYDDGSAGLAQWKWKSESDGTFYFSWGGEWYEDAYVEITTLTSSKLVITEEEGDGSIGVTTLVPAN
ncbi:MAG: hypothetical protein R3Y61_02965 [Rikenellaceae bacterium]